MNSFITDFKYLLDKKPNAQAIIKGSKKYSSISGKVSFYNVYSGVLVISELTGMPFDSSKCKGRIFAFHIHNGESCTGNLDDPFADASTHYNPDNCPHPYHKGDMPPLFSTGGRAFSAFLSDRFTIDEIIGKAVIVHSSPDDFTTQPSGNAGEKIACGIIKEL